MSVKHIVHCGINGYITSSSDSGFGYSKEAKQARLFTEDEMSEIYPSLNADHPLAEYSVMEVSKVLNDKPIYKSSNELIADSVDVLKHKDYMIIVSSWDEENEWDTCGVPVNSDTPVTLKENEAFEVVGMVNSNNWDSCAHLDTWGEADQFIGLLNMKYSELKSKKSTGVSPSM